MNLAPKPPLVGALLFSGGRGHEGSTAHRSPMRCGEARNIHEAEGTAKLQLLEGEPIIAESRHTNSDTNSITQSLAAHLCTTQHFPTYTLQNLGCCNDQAFRSVQGPTAVQIDIWRATARVNEGCSGDL